MTEPIRIDARRVVPVSQSGRDVLEVAVRLACGFLSAADIKVVAADPATRLYPLLVRCGGCRFTAPAQDITALIGYVTAGGDYVRDVSVPAR